METPKMTPDEERTAMSNIIRWSAIQAVTETVSSDEEFERILKVYGNDNDITYYLNQKHRRDRAEDEGGLEG